METLNLDDTLDLVKIFDVMDSKAVPETERLRVALMYLEDFIARRGFDENPVQPWELIPVDNPEKVTA